MPHFLGAPREEPHSRASFPAAACESSRPWLLLGHRGASGEAPENTFAAFELALEQGADGVEFDVHLSSDGVPVVIHDARLERTTNGTGLVGVHSLAALRRLDAGSWFNRRFPARARANYAGEKIPTLAETMEWVKQRRSRAFIELKRGRKYYPGIEAKVLEAIRRSATAALTTVISFDTKTLVRLGRMDRTVELGIDFTRPLAAVLRARRIGARALLPHWAFVTERFILRAHRAGLAVIVWGLDQPRRARRLVSYGADGIVTNFPARLAELRL
jgi:glycerophosphoryl diester phosphodiesterase